MSYRYNGIECDTIEEALALQRADAGTARAHQRVPRPVAAKAKPIKKAAKNPDQSNRMKKLWEQCRALAAKEGISVSEAMQRLKKQK